METRILFSLSSRFSLSENQCGMETCGYAMVPFAYGLVEREPMWDGNSIMHKLLLIMRYVEREPMGDGNVK